MRALEYKDPKDSELGGCMWSWRKFIVGVAFEVMPLWKAGRLIDHRVVIVHLGFLTLTHCQKCAGKRAG